MAGVSGRCRGSLFNGLGFATQVDEKLEGARGSHDVDVTARITVAGISQLWAIECKSWNRAVSKERILIFLSLINDIGADRGLMFCEKGFQAGAIRSAVNTNITLTSVADFKQNTAEEMASLRVRDLVQRIEALNQRFAALWDLSKEDRATALSRYAGPPGITGQATDTSAVGARLSQMQEAIESARFGRWPVWYWALGDETPISVHAWDALMFVVDYTSLTCERILNQMVNSDLPIQNWQDLQPPELTKLLETLRGRPAS